MKKYFKNFLENKCSTSDYESFVELFIDKKNHVILEHQMEKNWKETPFVGKTPDLAPTLYKIHYEINKLENGSGRLTYFLTFFTRIAAILLLSLCLAFFLQLQHINKRDKLLQTVSTPMASKTSFFLPDGSRVWLNSGSSIRFPKEFNGDERLVELVGEAYFDVKKNDQSFRVKTKSFTVDVLGTAFNVFAYDNEIPTITLERGKIVLVSKLNKQVVLSPGQQAIIDTSECEIVLKPVEPNLFSSWIDNELILKDEPLKEVITRLERWYNINIIVVDQELMEKRVTAHIEFESIREVMELMKLTLAINYEYDNHLRKLKIFAVNN